jgi:hypothetical protein
MGLDTIFQDIEQRILAGDLAGARTALRRVRVSRLSREDRSRYARLARRAEWPLGALNALATVIHPTPGSAPHGTPEERIEYALALARLRLVRESVELLETVDRTRHPQALLGLMAVHFVRWDYPAAIPLLRQYLAHPAASAYERVVAEVNLAAALVATDTGSETDALLARLLESAGAHRSDNLRGTVLLLLAQQALSRGALADARKYLAESRPLLEPRGGRHALVWCKWAALLDLRESGPTDRTAAALATVDHAARAQGEWETSRQLAAYWALATRSPVLIARVLHGTPHAGFRRWFAGKLTPAEREAERYSLELGSEPRQELPLRDALGGSAPPLARTILRALCSDAFRPIPLLELYPWVYPTADFDPTTGPERLKFALKTLRRALRDAKSPISVAATGEGYRLESHPPLRLWIPAQSEPSSDETGDDEALARLRELAEPLSSQSVARALGWSDRTARRFLARAVEQGTLVRTGDARATRYHFPLRKAG